MGKKEVPTLRQVLKNSAELEFWNNYVAVKINAGSARSLYALQDEVGKFNDLYQDEWLDRPVNDYANAMANYINLLNLDNFQ